MLKSILITLPRVGNNRGFTLIEIIAVLVLLSILGSVAYFKFDVLEPKAAEIMAVQMISNMNVETLSAWTKAKFSTEGWVDDENVKKYENYNGFPLVNGSLEVKTYKIKIKRIPSLTNNPAKWEKEE